MAGGYAFPGFAALVSGATAAARSWPSGPIGSGAPALRQVGDGQYDALTGTSQPGYTW
jgi:hypothetical protein